MAERIRGGQWMKIRRMVLSLEPRCVICLEKGRPATAVEVDHIVPLSKGGSNGLLNLRGLCRPCHLDATRKQFGHRVKPRIALDGWPEQD